LSGRGGTAGADGAGPARKVRTFERTAVWIFDLDNTLYPADCNLFAQVDQRMGEFIARFLGVPFAARSSSSPTSRGSGEPATTTCACCRW
jgi:hypothetical protein